MTDLDIAKIKEAAERMDLSWHQCDVTVGGSPLIIMQASAYIQMCAPHTILALIARLEASEARVKTLERMDREAATHVESVICMKSKHFTGEAPYIGWKGLGLALTQDYDALRAAEARNATAYAEGVEAAAKVAKSFDYSFQSATALDVLAIKISVAIRALLKDKPNG